MGFDTSPELAAAFAGIWPNAFSDNKPLKIGVRADIVASGVAAEDEVRAALRFYTSRTPYLLNIRVGEIRVDLDGNPAGVVTADEAAHAAATLQARRTRRAQPASGASAASSAPRPDRPRSIPPAPPTPSHRSPTPSPSPSTASPLKPKRLGLSDLRAAWQARQRAQARPATREREGVFDNKHGVR